MLATIKATTDGQFIGCQIDTDTNPIELPGGVLMHVDRCAIEGDQYRLINSNYIIDAEVKHG